MLSAVRFRVQILSLTVEGRKGMGSRGRVKRIKGKKVLVGV